MSDSEAAFAAFASAAAIALRSRAISICVSSPSSGDGALAPPVCVSPGLGCAPPLSAASSLAVSSFTSGWLKNRSKQLPSACFSSSLLASVKSNASRRIPLSANPTSLTARMASMVSAGDTRTPAPRAARKKRCSSWRISRTRLAGRLWRQSSSPAASRFRCRPRISRAR